MAQFFIYSWDPGLATGWSELAFYGDGTLAHHKCRETNHQGVGRWLYEEFSDDYGPLPESTVFVSESFTITQKKSPSPWSLETIGLIRWWADEYGIPFELVAPSQHKGLISDEVIKRAGLWVPGKGHAMDATRVGLWYAVVKKGYLHDCLVVDGR